MLRNNSLSRTSKEYCNNKGNKVTKRKLDDVELDNIVSSSNNQKIVYNKENIEKILLESTNKDIEVLLGSSREDAFVKEDAFCHSSANHELIKQVKLHTSKQSYDAHYYLIINLNKEDVVNGAYLAHLHYKKKCLLWKIGLIPLIDYLTVRLKIKKFLFFSFGDILMSMCYPRAYYDDSLTSGSIEQAIEYAKLRMKYMVLNDENFGKYQSEFNIIKLMHKKENIEKVLLESTDKNIEVLLGSSNAPMQDTLNYSSATDELMIKQAKLYASKQSYDAHYYLVINLNEEGVVNDAYLAHLYYSKHMHWKLRIIPLIGYLTIIGKLVFLTTSLEDIAVLTYNHPMYYDKSITSGSIDQVIEYAKLRMNYMVFNQKNFEQYQSELNNVKLNHLKS